MKKVLVTGGAGFIGSHLVSELLESGNKVVVIDNLSNGSERNLGKEVKLYKQDVSGKDLRLIFEAENPDIVFHLAAQISVEKSLRNPILDASTNILGALNVFDNCARSGVSKVVYVSTAAVYGEGPLPTKEENLIRPSSPYGLSKSVAEQYLKYFPFNYTILRLPNIYGPGQTLKGESGVVATFIDSALREELIYITGTGYQSRDFLYVSDVVEACLLVTKYIKTERETYNLSSSIEETIIGLFKYIKDLTGYPAKPQLVPSRSKETPRSLLDASKIKKELNWKPEVPLDEGLRKTIIWYEGELGIE